MNGQIMTRFAALILMFSVGLVQAQGSELCRLPVGKYEGKSVLIQDKVSGLVEQYVLELNVAEGGKTAGKLRLFDVTMDAKGTMVAEYKNRYFFELKGCNASQARFQATGPDIDGFIRVLDINRALSEITVSGAVSTYADGLYGMGQWLYDSVLEMASGEGAFEIDFRKLPIRLRKQL